MAVNLFDSMFPVAGFPGLDQGIFAVQDFNAETIKNSVGYLFICILDRDAVFISFNAYKSIIAICAGQRSMMRCSTVGRRC